MSGRLLDFSQYIGGADNVITVEMFPRSEKTYTYNFGFAMGGYTFSGDYQSILLDNVTYDRATGLPNFAETKVIGYFDNYTAIPSGNFNITGAATGQIIFTIPGLRYTGNIFPSARDNVVATVVTFQWDTTTAKEAHRYLVLERWEPGTPMGDPTLNVSPAFTALENISTI